MANHPLYLFTFCLATMGLLFLRLRAPTRWLSVISRGSPTPNTICPLTHVHREPRKNCFKRIGHQISFKGLFIILPHSLFTLLTSSPAHLNETYVVGLVKCILVHKYSHLKNV